VGNKCCLVPFLFRLSYWIRMSVCRSRSSSSGRNEDSVKRDQRSSSIADEDNPTVTMTTISRSRSISPPARPASKSQSRSKSRQRIRSRGRETSRSRNRSRGRSNLSGKARSRSKSKRLSSHRRPRSKRRSSKSRSRSSKRRNNEEGYRLHVADINAECRKKDLERLFQKYGPLKEIWLASYAPFYAFIVYRSRRDAEHACSRADGVSVSGRRIRVSMAKPRNTPARNRGAPGTVQ